MRLTEIVDRGHVRVIDAAGVRRLAIESADGLGVPRHRRMQHLDGALPAHLHVLGEINTSHSTGAQLFLHVIALGDDRTDKVRGHAALPVQRRPVLWAEALALGVDDAAGGADLQCAHSVVLCGRRGRGAW